AEVDHAHAGLDQAVALDQCLQLVGGARAHALGLRLLDVDVVEMFLQPGAAAATAGHDAVSAPPAAASGRHDTRAPRPLPRAHPCPHRSAPPRSATCAAWRMI